ncbi:hypothetical protein BDV30DRAFT_246708 [Aspergillus minisclerotigenes]|uniref:Uncharacterized protein n=1 Tax=Aspergillus minisclerotigenes TaxID=656917 RepID=A0A5N6IM27_9EURO|nr:hypothetical protein BDV30DRAFT_246708 [Aspergillus minisclerotigenes]
MATGWSLVFCLACDRQTLRGPYCSQYCRLAELDLTKAIVIDTPVSVYPQRTQRTTTEIAAKTPRASTVKDHIGNIPLPSNRSSTQSWMISPSSSQTPLSSLKSHLSQDPTISDRVQDQLRDYASCLDQVRDLKRRLAS